MRQPRASGIASAGEPLSWRLSEGHSTGSSSRSGRASRRSSINCSTTATGRLWSGACAFFDLCGIYPRLGGGEQERRRAAFVREHAIDNPQRLVEAIKIVLGQKLAFDLVGHLAIE